MISLALLALLGMRMLDIGVFDVSSDHEFDSHHHEAVVEVVESHHNAADEDNDHHSDDPLHASYHSLLSEFAATPFLSLPTQIQAVGSYENFKCQIPRALSCLPPVPPPLA